MFWTNRWVNVVKQANLDGSNIRAIALGVGVEDIGKSV